MFTLGINAVYHDCAAALIADGVVLAAAEEERFTHVKHGKRPVPFSTWQLPFHAIEFCLRQAGIRLSQVDQFAYSYDPARLSLGQRLQETITLPLQPSAAGAASSGDSPWEPLFLSYIVNAPRQLASGAPHHLAERFRGSTYAGIARRWHFVEHHLAHEASAFLASPFDQTAVLTMDGRGERATTSYGVFENGRYTRIKQVDLPHSLGLLYEQVTAYLGFLHSSDEYKVMALASYGEPRFVADFRDVVRLGSDGQYTVNEVRLDARFGPARTRGGPLEQRHYDVAHSLQVVLEETVVKLARWLHQVTHADALCLAGGVA